MFHIDLHRVSIKWNNINVFSTYKFFLEKILFKAVIMQKRLLNIMFALQCSSSQWPFSYAPFLLMLMQASNVNASFYTSGKKALMQLYSPITISLLGIEVISTMSYSWVLAFRERISRDSTIQKYCGKESMWTNCFIVETLSFFSVYNFYSDKTIYMSQCFLDKLL